MFPVVIDVRSAEDTRDVVHRAVQALVEGGIVAVPTETVYGLAASAMNESAVHRLLSAKGRDSDKPLALAIRSADEALDYVPDMCPLGRRLARRCWPGPITLVLDDLHPDSLLRQLPDSVQNAVAPAGTIGLRVPAHPLVLDIMQLVAGPVALTSANRGGAADAVTADEVVRSLEEDVQLVLDDGRSRYGQPSTVVRVSQNKFELLREGVVSEQTLKRLSSFIVLFVCTGNTCRSPMAEAMFRKLIAEGRGCEPAQLEDHDVIVMSAGTSAMLGGCASPETIEVMARQGLDASDHGTQPVSEQLVRQADVIFAMTNAHRQVILAEWPEAAGRTKLLCTDGSEVADPIGGPIEHYQRCAEQIKAQLEVWIDQLDL